MLPPPTPAAAARVVPGLDAALQRTFTEIAREAIRSFSRRDGRLLGGAVAFYSLLSIIPVLLIAIYVSGIGARDAATRAGLLGELSRWIGADGAATVAALIGRAGAAGSSPLTRILHAAVVVYASTRLFQQLKGSINRLWDVEAASPAGVRGTLLTQARKHATSFLMVVLIEVILLALVGLKTVLAVSAERLGPAFHASTLIQVGEWPLSFGVVTLVFATMFRVLPDARIAWRDLWVGATVTALLFSAGASVVSRYLSYKSVHATFGDGGSIVMLLLWVNYSAQVFFLGVAFTGVWAEKKGGGIRPLPGARVGGGH
jgi:membrane protein